MLSEKCVGGRAREKGSWKVNVCLLERGEVPQSVSIVALESVVELTVPWTKPSES